MTKKDRAMTALAYVHSCWCLYKIDDGGCEGCPMDINGSSNLCLLALFENYIRELYDDNLKRITKVNGGEKNDR